jgi:hypothetical protein
MNELSFNNVETVIIFENDSSFFAILADSIPIITGEYEFIFLI